MPIRIRLTLWYLLILTIVLASVAAGVYAFVSNEERQSVDRVLRERADAFARAYAGEAKEQPGDAAILEVARDYGRGSPRGGGRPAIHIQRSRPVQLFRHWIAGLCSWGRSGEPTQAAVG